VLSYQNAANYRGDIMYKHEEWTSGKKSGLIAEPDIKVYQITPEGIHRVMPKCPYKTNAFDSHV